MTRIAATTAILAIAAGASADEALAKVRNCHSWAYYPNVLISLARNMKCKTAKKDMRRYKGSIKKSFTTPGGFHCHRVSGGRLGGQWRCVKGAKAYRFEFGD
jgi:hypothetical protein